MTGRFSRMDGANVKYGYRNSYYVAPISWRLRKFGRRGDSWNFSGRRGNIGVVMGLPFPNSMRSTLAIFTISVACGPLLTAAQYNGSVRAADTFVPGAIVTAQQGDKKVSVFTDENGRYAMDLAPGVWDIQVEMFEFTPEKGQATIGSTAVTKNWVLSMPKLAQRGGSPAAPSAQSPQTAATPPAQTGGRGRTGTRAGRGGFGARGGPTAQGGRGGRGAAGGQGGQAQPQPGFKAPRFDPHRKASRRPPARIL